MRILFDWIIRHIYAFVFQGKIEILLRPNWQVRLKILDKTGILNELAEMQKVKRTGLCCVFVTGHDNYLSFCFL